MATPMAEDSSFEDDQLASMTTEDIIRGSRLVDNEIRILKVWYLTITIIMFDLIVFFFGFRIVVCLGFWF